MINIKLCISIFNSCKIENILHNTCHFNLTVCFQHLTLQLYLKIIWSLAKIKIVIILNKIMFLTDLKTDRVGLSTFHINIFSVFGLTQHGKPSSSLKPHNGHKSA